MRAIAHEGVNPTAVILESPFDRLLSTVRHRFDTMGIPSMPAAELLRSRQQNIEGFAHNLVDYAHTIECPAIVMYGEFDKRVTLQEVESVFDALPGRKEFVIFQP